MLPFLSILAQLFGTAGAAGAAGAGAISAGATGATGAAGAAGTAGAAGAAGASATGVAGAAEIGGAGAGAGATGAGAAGMSTIPATVTSGVGAAGNAGNGIESFFGNIGKGTGEVLNNVGKGVEKIGKVMWDSTTQGQIQNELKQQSFLNDMKVVEQIPGGEGKIEGLQSLMNKYPKLAQIQQQMNKIKMNLPKQSPQKTEDDAAIARASELSTILKNTQNPETHTSFDPDLQKSIIDKMKETFGTKSEYGPPAELANNPTSEFNYTPESNYGPPVELANNPSDAASLFSHQNPRLAQGAYDFLGEAGEPPMKQYPNNKGLFSGGVDPFQASTSTSPMQNIPPSFADLGITDKATIQMFSEIEKALPDVDLRSQFRSDPEVFLRLFDAVARSRNLPDGSKMTLQQAIELIRASQE